MAGPALQLFPPARPQRQTSPNRKPKTPEPEPERMESAKTTQAPANFHELIIQVNSTPVSPATEPVNNVPAPPKAYVPVQTPPQESQPLFDSPPRPRQPSPVLQRNTSVRGQYARAPTPQEYGRESPAPNRTVSPAFSTSPTLVRANSSATQMRSMSPQGEVAHHVPMRSMFPMYDPTIPLTHQQYAPAQASPTHIPRTQISRSPYSPGFYVPHSNIAGDSSQEPAPKPFFTPSNLLDNLWLACNGQEDPTVQMYTLRMNRPTPANPTITFGPTPSLPFYSLTQANLAGDNNVQSIMNELLIQRHHPTQPRVLPIAHLDLIAPPSMDTTVFAAGQQGPTLVTSIYPKLAALQALDFAANSPAASHIAVADPGAVSPAAQRLAEDVLMGAAQRECCTLLWTRDSPTQQSNPWAQHLPSEGTYQLHHPTLGTFPIKIEGDCSLINKPSSRPVTAIYAHNMPSTPRLNNGSKAASITLLNPYILSPTTPQPSSLSFSPLPPPPPLPGYSARPASLTPSEVSISHLPTASDASPSDAMLARLDFGTDALTLNLAALSHFGNPFLVDVATSTLLSIAVAESVRGRSTKRGSQDSFEPPPPSFLLNKPTEPSTAQAFKESFVDGFETWGGKGKPKPPISGSALRKWSLKSSATLGRSSKSSSSVGMGDKDIELGEWYGQNRTKHDVAKETRAEKKARKKVEDEDKLPWVARGIIGILMFVFKAVVFVLKIFIKVIAGLVVMVTKNRSKLVN
ncbi:hypothetical protein B0J11DRAFT_421465 [Dendryphion nanum]|uniref:Uncharacterized protein n=1 Tax=Dendryphion nanum TaxID=256645 RepID=A0A9P9ELY7_9PLEO|nr:hypothetical protein B0J11DRAFT_421465 [Dendryphion nanum]